MAQALAHFRPTFARRRGLIRDMSKLGNVKARKTPAGEARWYILIAGHKIYRGRDNVGEWNFESEAEAQRYLDRIRARLEDGMELDKLLDQILPKPRRSIVQLSTKWLAAKWESVAAKRIEARSYRVIEGVVKNHWGYWKDTPADGLTRGMLDDYASHLGSKGLKPATVQYVLATMRSFYGWLYDREEIQRIPSFPTITVPEYSPTIITRDQQSLILAQIPEAQRGIFIALCDCGLRPGEARALWRSHLRADGWLMVRQAAKDRGHTAPIGPTKTRRNRDIPPLTERIHEWLAANPPTGMLLFTCPHDTEGRGWMWCHKELGRVWRKACAAADIDDATPYEATKHSTGTALRERGNSLESLMGFYGHTSTQHTQRYAKARPAELLRLREIVK
jgi:site-specific recombinase XerD